jgi:catechol 2,3-dioxygenase-like lactoylglutathione lyase family enzyme
MKLNAGIITAKLQETKAFYTQKLGFGITFESDWFLLLHTPDGAQEISFLQPGHPTQQPIFQPEFTGKGVYLTIEVDNVDETYEQMKARNVPLAFELRDEPWGDRHFAIIDPNGVGVDIVTYRNPTG